MVNVELSKFEIRYVMDIILDKIDYGGDVGTMRTYIQLYDKFEKLVSEENSINE